MHDEELPASQATSFVSCAAATSEQAGEPSIQVADESDSSNKFSSNSSSSSNCNLTAYKTVTRSREGQSRGVVGAAGDSLLKLLRGSKKGRAVTGRSRLEELISSPSHKSWCEQRTIIVNIKNGPKRNQDSREQEQVLGRREENSNECNKSEEFQDCLLGSDASLEIADRLFDSLNLNQQEVHTTSGTLAAVKTRGRILARDKQQSRQSQQQQPNQQVRSLQEEQAHEEETERKKKKHPHRAQADQDERGRARSQEDERQHQVALVKDRKREGTKTSASDLNQVSAGELTPGVEHPVAGGEGGNPEEIRGEEEDEEDVENDREKGRRSTGLARAAAYKLSRLPYFSYHGKARNVNLLSAASRKQQEQQVAQNNFVGSSAESSASSSQRSLNSLTSGIPTLTRRFGASSTTSGSSKSFGSDEQRAQERRRSAGYSNISNIYPSKARQASSSGEATRQVTLRFEEQKEDPLPQRQSYRVLADRKRLTGSPTNLNDENQQKQHNKSLNPSRRRNSFNQSNLSKQHRSLSSSHSTSLLASPDSGNIETKTPAASTMRRQYSSHLGGGTLSKSVSGNKFGSAGGYRDRPGSASGYTLARQHKSPSTSSLLYAGNSTGVSPFASRNDPSLVDPDCPVHGYSPVGGGLSKSSQHLAQPELLYENDYPPADGYYPDTRARAVSGGNGGSRGNLYSPSSPSPQQLVASSRRAGRSPRAGTGAYYDSASRFSLYHSPSSEVRSSLAPPNEQLRRILGYQPSAVPRPVHLHPQWAYSRPFIHLQGPRSPSPSGPLDPMTGEPLIKPIFEPFNQLQDSQAVRAVDFHPSGEVYAVGSNSRALRICAYPADYELRHFSAPISQQQQQQQFAPNHKITPPPPPRVLFKFLQLHRGSIYCVRFNATGQLLATGSNDQTVHIVRYNSTTHSPDGDEYRLTMHDGTIRDLTFIDDSINGSALLLSAGGGDNKIYVTDCDTITPFQSMSGHTQTVMALHHWAGASFVSASLDRSIRFWDLRTRHCTSIVSAPPSTASSSSKGAGPGAPVCSVKVDPSGRLLASGHSDATCMLYDIRAARIIQAHKPHDDEIRTLGFSPKSYYLLTGGYDGRILLTDLQGDLTQPLPTCCVAESADKVVQARWHPSDFTFVTTSADKTATLWAMPTE